MKKDKRCFPAKTIDEIRLNKEEIVAIQKENLLKYSPENHEDEHQNAYLATQVENGISCYKNVPQEVEECYEFSNYLIDPNKRRFKTVVRIIALVLKFVKNLRKKGRPLQDRKQVSKVILFTEDELKEADNYFFKKATLEVKKFAKPSQYEKISTEAKGILYFNGRILPTDGISAACEMTAVMKDLASTSFCVPVIYGHSPLAYSIINEIHWYSNVAKHSGVETIWRYVLKVCFILCGREIVKKIKIHCERCRYLCKRTIDVEMGPVSSYNMKIAPAFYGTQVDICGPLKAYSPHNKRTTIKIWLVVFCCMTTSTTSIKVMEDYSTIAFVQAFTRFACEVGYPQFMLIDEGSQLVKGCESMRLTFTNIKNK